jgi:hypothetical protein
MKAGSVAAKNKGIVAQKMVSNQAFVIRVVFTLSSHGSCEFAEYIAKRVVNPNIRIQFPPKVKKKNKFPTFSDLSCVNLAVGNTSAWTAWLKGSKIIPFFWTMRSTKVLNNKTDPKTK